ncbi:MAG: formylmethanofuran dehydrogenase subunit E family protein [Candidatus Thermoplasmatota archaeon]
MIAKFILINMPNSKLKHLKEFHGHLGPYAVIGFRMGLLAVEKVGKGKGLKCIVKTGLTIPLSCIIDGIQFSSSCTLGKGNIKVRNESKAEAEFTKENKKIKIKLKDKIREKIDRKMEEGNEEELALQLYRASDDELFDYSLSTR